MGIARKQHSKTELRDSWPFSWLRVLLPSTPPERQVLLRKVWVTTWSLGETEGHSRHHSEFKPSGLFQERARSCPFLGFQAHEKKATFSKEESAPGFVVFSIEFRDVLAVLAHSFSSTPKTHPGRRTLSLALWTIRVVL